jgi:hypothetical protein
VRVALVTDQSCGECYELKGSQWSFEVHAGGLLGIQYGLAELLEAMGFRFFHPWESKAPGVFQLPDKSGAFGHLFTPQMTRRGLHLHTLHPIEGYYAFWEPGSSQLQDARRISDWLVKNRGNYLEWSALDNILQDAQTQADWQSHTAAILADAHQRGLQVGLGFEMFGTANLQLSYVALDTETETDPKSSVDQRLHTVLDGLPFDTIDISFGEFSGTDPNVFLQSLNLISQELGTIAPGTELAATIHMDASASLQVTYMGETLPYYFLVQFADPRIVPWIHSVMYFDLFQNADGAYGYQDFSQHLGYLQNRLKASQAVAYYPESAYWIAFDDSVPTYLPVYMRSRWLDMSQLQSQATQGGYGPLTQHVLFSSGWEWGYWQNDYATLRMNFGLPASWDVEVQNMLEPWGSEGAALAKQIAALGELQSHALIDQALAPYMAGRDAVIDVGATMNIVSQPPRPAFSDVAAMTADDRAAFQTSVLGPLSDLQSGIEAIQAAVGAIGLDRSDPWLGETLDGIDVDVDRTRFINALYQAVASFAAQGSDGGWLAKADAAMSDAQTIVSRRHSHLHYPNGGFLTQPTDNATLYQYGYLYEADTLCYWQRESFQAKSVVTGQSMAAPSCVLSSGL